MPEPVFTPYVPRRLRAAEPQLPSQARVQGESPDEPALDVDGPAGPADPPVPAVDEGSDAALHAPAAGPAPAAPPTVETDADPAAGERAAALADAIAAAQRLADIRNEAVRLAAIACGKALRRAMLLDPALLARFVDEALSAAQGPDGVVVRLNPKDVAAGAPPDRDTIADPSLAPGEFTIDAAAGTISGALQERAALLVLAAAHASHASH